MILLNFLVQKLFLIIFTTKFLPPLHLAYYYYCQFSWYFPSYFFLKIFGDIIEGSIATTNYTNLNFFYHLATIVSNLTMKIINLILYLVIIKIEEKSYYYQIIDIIDHFIIILNFLIFVATTIYTVTFVSMDYQDRGEVKGVNMLLKNCGCY